MSEEQVGAFITPDAGATAVEKAKAEMEVLKVLITQNKVSPEFEKAWWKFYEGFVEFYKAESGFTSNIIDAPKNVAMSIYYSKKAIEWRKGLEKEVGKTMGNVPGQTELYKKPMFDIPGWVWVVVPCGLGIWFLLTVVKKSPAGRVVKKFL
jgi:hypothetical protein